MGERLVFLDIAKGIGILLIMASHYPISSLACDWIFSFHVPLFFIISGYLYNYRPFLSQIKIDFKRLLKPIFLTTSVSCILLALLFCRSGIYRGPEPIEWLRNAYLGIGKEAIIGMWFLWALFWGRIGLCLLRIIKKRIIADLICILLFVVLTEFVEFANINIPFYFPHGLLILFFLRIGEWCKERDIFSVKLLPMEILFLIMTVIFAYKMPIITNCFVFPNGFFSGIVASGISISFIFCCYYLGIFCKCLIPHLTILGQNTLLVLCLHAVVHTLQIPKLFTSAYLAFCAEFLFILLVLFLNNRLKILKILKKK